MPILDNSVVVCIALLYNLFIHHIASTIYKNLGYHEKNQSINTFLIASGISGIVISKLILKKDQKYSDSVVSKGLVLGGILLLLTVSLISWTDMSDETRLLISGAGFVSILYIANKFFDKKDNIKDNKKIDVSKT